MIERSRQRVDVGAGGGFGIVHLRRGVPLGTVDAGLLHANATPRLNDQPRFGRAKVYQAGLAGILVNDNVGRLDVVVDDGRLLPGQVGEHTAQLDTPAQDVFDRVGSAPHQVALDVLVGQPLEQVVSFDVLHHDIVAAVLGKVGRDAGDAVVTQAGQHAPLLLEALLGFLHRLEVGQVKVLEHFLDDTLAAEGSQVLHQVDGAHTAFAQRPHDAVDGVHRLARLQGDVGPRSTERE